MKYRIMKNKRGRYRILGKKWHGWSWILGEWAPGPHKDRPDIFETDTFQSAEDYVTEMMEAKDWAAKANDWNLIRELEG